MSRKEYITNAIAAHGLWKAHLQRAISTGNIDKSVNDIRADNCCEFGQWLYGSTIGTEDKNSPFYKDIKDLHAQFHRLAGDIAQLAVDKKTEEATEKLKGDYKDVSANLTRKMFAWISA